MGMSQSIGRGLATWWVDVEDKRNWTGRRMVKMLRGDEDADENRAGFEKKGAKIGKRMRKSDEDEDGDRDGDWSRVYSDVCREDVGWILDVN